MGSIFGFFGEYYYLILVLQAICVWHSYRRGTQQKWIWVIVFLPVVGSVVYIFSEIIQRRHVSAAKGGLLDIVNPGGRIKKLEKNFEFSGTFTNRIALADAYLEAGMYDKAIALYEPVLTGNLFDNSDGAIKNLMQAYYKANRFNDVVKIAPKVLNSLEFTKSKANLYYALSLEEISKSREAETEFKKMNQRFCNYEQRCHYGLFLQRQNQQAEAQQVFSAMVSEGQHLSGHEKRDAGEWISRAKQELRKASASV